MRIALRKIKSIIIFSALLIYLFNSCSNNEIKPAKGVLEISFTFNELEKIKPSYQTAIWLEKEDEAYVKTLLVSEYLAYGGYNDSIICPHWIEIADWENGEETEFNTVTSATPAIGDNKLEISCKEWNILPGFYRYFIQVHVVEDENVTYAGEIEIGNQNTTSEAEQDFIPGKYPNAQNVLTDVKLNYYR